MGGSAARSRGAAKRRRARARARRGAPPSPSCAAALVEARRRRPRSTPWPTPVREDEHDPVVLRQVERLQLEPSPRPSCGPSARKNGTSAPSAAASAWSSAAGSGVASVCVGEPECRRRVGAAAAETGRDRDPLRDRRTPARLDAGGGGERGRARRGRACRRGSRSTASAGRGLDRDAVGEVDPLQDGRDLVLAVRAGRADDEREVELRRRRRSSQRLGERDELRRRERLGTRLRRAADRLERRRRDLARASPASASEFGSVLRRWANAASTTA